MASIRNLKKDIDFLTNEVISDAYLAMDFHGEKVKEQVVALLEEVVDFHNYLYEKIQMAPTGKKNPEKKRYFRDIRQEMNTKFPQLFKTLSNIIAQQK